MALDQSALLDVLEALKTATVNAICAGDKPGGSLADPPYRTAV
jgi:hypothetical protein